MKIKAVLFDLGNTLVYQEPYEAFQRILRANGINKSLKAIREAFERGNIEFEVERNEVPSPRDFYARWNALILKHLGITRSLDRLAAEIDRQWFNFSQSHLYPEVKKSLNRLRKMGLRLGLVTSGYQLDLEQILPEVGLQEFFDVQVCADTVGKRKPHPEAFVYALKQLGVEPQETVFVGDNYEIDYLGAQNAGMLPVLIRRDGASVSGIRTIKTLDDIFDVLAEVNG